MDVTDPENPATVQATMIEAAEMINTLESTFASPGVMQLKAAIQ